MVKFIGYSLVVGGYIAGIYVAFWLLLADGIMDIILYTQTTTEGGAKIDILWGVLKIILAGPVGSLVVYALAIPGVTIVESQRKKETHKRFRK